MLPRRLEEGRAHPRRWLTVFFLSISYIGERYATCRFISSSCALEPIPDGLRRVRSEYILNVTPASTVDVTAPPAYEAVRGR
jgi:hypothetical protein